MHRTCALIGAFLATCSLAVAGEPGDTVSGKTGWLLPGSASFSFRHRIVATSETNPILERSFRGEFRFGFRKPIYTGTASETDIRIVTQLPYAGFDEGGKRIILPVATFRIEISYRHELGDEGLALRAGIIHFSSHLMDPIRVEGLPDLIQAARLKLNVEALNVLRVGVEFERHQDHTFLTDFGGETGIQPIRISYFLLTEANQAFNRTSYEPYDHRLYLRIFAGKQLGGHRLSFIADGEAERNLRGSLELRYSTDLHTKPNEDGLQVFVAYDGGIGENEITTTPWGGTTRGNWLTLGFRVVI